MPKVNSLTISAWASLLHRIPGSTMLIKNHGLADPLNREDLREAFVAKAIAEDRVFLESWNPDVREHLDRYNQIDVALDTFPYNGTTTTCEALWMGVPVVTLIGNCHRARVGASLLSAIRRPDLITTSVEEYVAVAQRVAADTDGRRLFRMGARTQMLASGLMDARGCAMSLEEAYYKMAIDAPTERSTT